MEEKLRLVEMLWDDIGAANEPVILHAWHVTEASRRAAELNRIPQLQSIETNCGVVLLLSHCDFIHRFPRTRKPLSVGMMGSHLISENDFGPLLNNDLTPSV